jgi:hypothetical protein
VLALGGSEDKIGGGLDRAQLVSFAGLHFELAADAQTNERLARVASAAPVVGGHASASRRSATASPNVSPVLIASWASAGLGEPDPERAPTPTEAVPRGAPRRDGALSWRWRRGEAAQGGEGEVLTPFGRASVAERPGGMLAHVWLSEDARAAHLVLSGLAALLLHRRGGGILHGASVALDGRAIAFVGPSGAGKSTACRHVPEGELFSVDRLAVLPVTAPSATGAGSAGARAMWFAHPLPGGTRAAADLPSAEERWLPLAGVLRVQRATEGARVCGVAGAGAVATLRESAFQIGSGASAEAELLATLETLAHGVPVARLELALGACLTPVLRRWLVDQPQEMK